jgi:hypothetical protein
LNQAADFFLKPVGLVLVLNLLLKQSFLISE